RGKAPPLTDFADAFGRWVSGEYHLKPHQGDGMDGRPPAKVFLEHLRTKRTASPALLDMLLLKPTPPVKVTQNGVTYNGILYGQNEPALWPLLGKQVILRIDPEAISRVYV